MPGLSRTADRQPGLSCTHERRQDRIAALVLAVPFLVMVAVLRGMTVALPIFHGTDEFVYHYPTILRFSRELPFPDLHAYGAAQTPLFHLLMAYVGKAIGYQLWRLRLVEVLISYLLALAVYGLLTRRLAMDSPQATILALLFALSPYVFGQSFRLVTDNLALLFSVLALDRFEASRQNRALGPFLAGCALVGAAMLTRQSTAFMLALAGLYALGGGVEPTPVDRGVALGAIVLCAVPVGLLFLNWHGLIPVGGDPASCGLCARHGASGISTRGLELQTTELALASIGLYGAILFAPLLLGRPLGELTAQLRGPLIGAALGAALLLVFPATPGPHAAGDIWKIAAKLPAIDGTSALLWVLVPLAGAVLWIRLPRGPQPWPAAVLAATFLVSTVAISYPWQKYTDPFALLILMLTVRPRELTTRRGLAGVAVLALLFIAYTADFSSHRPVPHATPTARSATLRR